MVRTSSTFFITDTTPSPGPWSPFPLHWSHVLVSVTTLYPSHPTPLTSLILSSSSRDPKFPGCLLVGCSYNRGRRRTGGPHKDCGYKNEGQDSDDLQARDDWVGERVQVRGASTGTSGPSDFNLFGSWVERITVEVGRKVQCSRSISYPGGNVNFFTQIRVNSKVGNIYFLESDCAQGSDYREPTVRTQDYTFETKFIKRSVGTTKNGH